MLSNALLHESFNLFVWHRNCKTMFFIVIKIHIKPLVFRDLQCLCWRYGSVVKSTYFSYLESKSDPRTHIVIITTIISVSGDLILPVSMNIRTQVQKTTNNTHVM